MGRFLLKLYVVRAFSAIKFLNLHRKILSIRFKEGILTQLLVSKAFFLDFGL